MNRLNAVTRISICLAFLTIGTLLLADAAGLIPHAADIVRRERTALAESTAVHSSILASRGDFAQLEAALQATASRNNDIQSMGVRTVAGRLLIDIGQHSAHWLHENKERSSETEVLVPIYAGQQLWGRVEISFVDASATNYWGSYDTYLLELLLFAGVFSYCMFYLFLSRVLTHLDPTRVVPDRVRRALDSLTGGLLLIDDQQRIVLANTAFAKTAGTTPDALQGRVAQSLPWKSASSDQPPATFPWERTLAACEATTGENLVLQTTDDQEKIFMVNASPIVDDGGRQHGVLASFDDVTLLERKKNELLQIVTALKESQEAVREQNEELRRLATQDALTGCVNRRAFFEYFEMQWSAAQRYDTALSCVMLDIDHFKAINDTHGHAAGDAVLKEVGAALRRVARDSDLVGRYGGEEFSILLTHTNLDDAALFAERCRKAIANLTVQGIRVTVSLGLSARALGAANTQQLLEQSDLALYAAKHAGRNRCVRWDAIEADSRAAENSTAKQVPVQPHAASTETIPSIPFNAVNALLSALAYRDSATAAHSNRVADYCAALVRRCMTVSEAYVLEIAALLHDIGKVGVPDSILLKPGKLTQAEWAVMRRHEIIGVEIIASSFANPLLNRIAKEHALPFRGDATKPNAPTGQELSLGARILCIADAYDSMVADALYRQARSPAEALAELRKFAGTQFDPELVEQFVTLIETTERKGGRQTAGIPRDAALMIGTQVERIAQAVDELDMESLGHLASRLQSTAAKHHLNDMSTIADKLAHLLEDAPDAVALMQTTFELMDLSRNALRSHVDESASNKRRGELTVTQA